MLLRLWREDEGVLTFEWILLLTVLVIGIVGGLTGVRDAIIEECTGVAAAMVSLNQSYEINAPIAIGIPPLGGVDSGVCSSGAGTSVYVDTGLINTDRASGTITTGDPNLTPMTIGVNTTGTVCPLQ
jgi:Flp pilus assembly pilin Flp